MKTAQVRFLDPGQNVAKAGLVGAGRLEFTTDGVRLVGKKPKKALPTAIAWVVGLACMLGAIIGMIALHLDRGRGAMKLMAVVGILAGVVPGALLYNFLIATLPGIDVDQTIPWAKLQTVRTTANQVVLANGDLGGQFTVQAASAADHQVLAEYFSLAQKLPG